jgi:DNA (cytosine-5)-methyltransferase 1
MRLLDLFCGAGGAAVGYHRAGFQVTGVDIEPQPRYPFTFIQADAMEFPLEGFDVIHASPPCQHYSEATPIEARKNHPDLIAPIRERLRGKNYVIENVDGARRELRDQFVLCGTMFNLRVFRHRWFEVPSLPLILVPPCKHDFYPVVVSGSAHGRGEAKVPEMIEAMGVPWMKIRKEVREAIPPAYTEFIGKHLLASEAMTSEGLPK